MFNRVFSHSCKNFYGQPKGFEVFSLGCHGFWKLRIIVFLFYFNINGLPRILEVIFSIFV